MDGVEVRRGEGAKVDGNTAASDLLLICQNILKCESDVTKAKMNRTALIGPFDREASEATEAQRAASSEQRASPRSRNAAMVRQQQYHGTWT